MVKITIHHNVFAQSLSVSIKIAQLHVYHQILYLAEVGRGVTACQDPHPSARLAVRFATQQLTFPFGCDFWSRQVEGPDRKGIRAGEKISLINIRHLWGSRSPLNPSLCCSVPSLGGKMGRKEDPTEHLFVGS